MATGGRNGTPHIDTGFSICQDIQEDFRKKAWNKSGANLLAVTCYYAQVKQRISKAQRSYYILVLKINIYFIANGR